MTRTDSLPTFRELRLRQRISLEALYAYAEQTIGLEQIQLFDETGRADPYTVDDLLFILSKLSGQRYERAQVSGIIFVLARPPASPTNPHLQTGPLPAYPTLLDLYYGYTLDLDWLGEALGMEDYEVWKVLMGDASNSEDPARVLHLIEQYTGTTYLLNHGRLEQTESLSSTSVGEGLS